MPTRVLLASQGRSHSRVSPNCSDSSSYLLNSGDGDQRRCNIVTPLASGGIKNKAEGRKNFSSFLTHLPSVCIQFRGEAGRASGRWPWRRLPRRGCLRCIRGANEERLEAWCVRSPTDERWSRPVRGHTHLPNFGFQAQLENFTRPPATTVLLQGLSQGLWFKMAMTGE